MTNKYDPKLIWPGVLCHLKSRVKKAVDPTAWAGLSASSRQDAERRFAEAVEDFHGKFLEVYADGVCTRDAERDAERLAVVFAETIGAA